MRKKGITLIALIVTIVILLILTAVTIESVNMNGEIIGRSKEGAKIFNREQKRELAMTENFNIISDSIINNDKTEGYYTIDENGDLVKRPFEDDENGKEGKKEEDVLTIRADRYKDVHFVYYDSLTEQEPNKENCNFYSQDFNLGNESGHLYSVPDYYGPVSAGYSPSPHNIYWDYGDNNSSLRIRIADFGNAYYFSFNVWGNVVDKDGNENYFNVWRYPGRKTQDEEIYLFTENEEFKTIKQDADPEKYEVTMDKPTITIKDGDVIVNSHQKYYKPYVNKVQYAIYESKDETPIYKDINLFEGIREHHKYYVRTRVARVDGSYVYSDILETKTNEIERGVTVQESDIEDLEYVEGNGESYIDLDYKADGKSGFDIKYTDGNRSGVMFGSYYPYYNNGTGMFYNITSPNHNPHVWMHYDGIIQTSCKEQRNGIIKIRKNDININGVDYVKDKPEKEITQNPKLVIFGGNDDNNRIIYPAGYKLHYFIIYNEETPIIKLTPAKRKSTRRVGLYDKANKKFYKMTNQGKVEQYMKDFRPYN